MPVRLLGFHGYIAALISIKSNILIIWFLRQDIGYFSQPAHTRVERRAKARNK